MTRRAFLQVALLAPASLEPEECATPGYILVSGELNSSDHEAEEGWFAVGQSKGAALVFDPNGTSWRFLMNARGTKGELVWRPIK